MEMEADPQQRADHPQQHPLPLRTQARAESQRVGEYCRPRRLVQVEPVGGPTGELAVLVLERSRVFEIVLECSRVFGRDPHLHVCP